jgi:hypothetical protein
MTSSREAINAFVRHLWDGYGIDASKAKTEFLKKHDMVHDIEELGVPHYCSVCGVMNTVGIPR